MNRDLGIVGATLIALTLVGCGGGSSTPGTSSAKSVARMRAIESTRITRNTFAIIGIGRHVTRAPHVGMGRRAERLLAALLHHSRDVQQGKDDDTGLYYTMLVNADGSGRQDLFTDAGRQSPAGAFTWNTPQWNGGRIDNYPATIHFDYQLTAGSFAGDRGTIDMTLNDATGNNGTMHLTFTDSRGEKNVADFTIVNGVLTARETVTMEDGSDCTEVDAPDSTGGMVCTITFPDGSKEVMDMNADGTGTETITDPGGKIDATTTFQSDGMETINYDDGSSETVNVDTSDA